MHEKNNGGCFIRLSNLTYHVIPAKAASTTKTSCDATQFSDCSKNGY